MILSAHQPAYLPWLGYFDKILRCDTFVFLDTVQFEKNSFINRNLIKTPQGTLWLTIPVKQKGHISSTLLETEIDYSTDWIAKHLKSIGQNYRKAPRFEICMPKLEALYQNRDPLLADFCFRGLEFWLAELGIKTRVVRAKELQVDGRKSDLILNLCKHFNATKYLSGKLGKDYLDLTVFNEAKIEVNFQEYEHPVYQQLYGDFVPNLSVLDFWMNSKM